MPLRDHFRPPSSCATTLQQLDGQWSPRIVMQGRHLLPPGFSAGPRVQLGYEGSDDIVSEVRVYQDQPDRPLVATLILVSPRDKDRSDRREAFISKCLALVHLGIAVTLVNVITTREANLRAGLMAALGYTDPT